MANDCCGTMRVVAKNSMALIAFGVGENWEDMK